MESSMGMEGTSFCKVRDSSLRSMGLFIIHLLEEIMGSGNSQSMVLSSR